MSRTSDRIVVGILRLKRSYAKRALRYATVRPVTTNDQLWCKYLHSPTARGTLPTRYHICVSLTIVLPEEKSPAVLLIICVFTSC